MATKQQVRNKLIRQGAKFEEGYTGSGNYFFEAWLPDGLIWDNNYDSGVNYQEREYGESMEEFWDSFMGYINYPVIKKEDAA
jgi:hypothetical protein